MWPRPRLTIFLSPSTLHMVFTLSTLDLGVAFLGWDCMSVAQNLLNTCHTLVSIPDTTKTKQNKVGEMVVLCVSSVVVL